jgi:hypothetical protein
MHLVLYRTVAAAVSGSSHESFIVYTAHELRFTHINLSNDLACACITTIC